MIFQSRLGPKVSLKAIICLYYKMYFINKWFENGQKCCCKQIMILAL